VRKIIFIILAVLTVSGANIIKNTQKLKKIDNHLNLLFKTFESILKNQNRKLPSNLTTKEKVKFKEIKSILKKIEKENPKARREIYSRFFVNGESNKVTTINKMLDIYSIKTLSSKFNYKKYSKKDLKNLPDIEPFKNLEKAIGKIYKIDYKKFHKNKNLTSDIAKNKRTLQAAFKIMDGNHYNLGTTKDEKDLVDNQIKTKFKEIYNGLISKIKKIKNPTKFDKIFLTVSIFAYMQLDMMDADYYQYRQIKLSAEKNFPTEIMCNMFVKQNDSLAINVKQVKADIEEFKANKTIVPLLETHFKNGGTMDDFFQKNPDLSEGIKRYFGYFKTIVKNTCFYSRGR